MHAFLTMKHMHLEAVNNIFTVLNQTYKSSILISCITELFFEKEITYPVFLPNMN